MKDVFESKELLVSCVEQLEEKKVLELAKQALEQGMNPLALINLIIEGMNRVGKRYENKDYYIADLIMAGIIFREVLGLSAITSYSSNHYKNKRGKVLIGTVKDDIHDIGKEIFRALLETHGFEVIDLGVDVSGETFVQKAIEYQPQIIGLSGVLTNTLDQMKQVVDEFTKAGLRDKVKIIAGANYLNPHGCHYIGADGFATEASKGIEICLEWTTSHNGMGEIYND
ncbi:putative cobalamin binding protein [Desulfosporosinus orientis DSM 765]|uniref:Putative cobalamin binding protein n=1 Tax=Desulfosporosinus orientis (strain ATCC 19365 / DSM 765 / NCIMB 8382 / VKM B-1628 / Singapore I) TaxID=768706 RepID=G7W630_DESOD|nr:cobalamin-dependent protein [Desulfosporosinus orientis]AET67692.1 putative cobalamin binding protein [Desulfosporosinus orientis DSM 765]